MADPEAKPTPTPRPPARQPRLRPARIRVDGRLKVTGGARYASDLLGGPNPAHAYLRTSRDRQGPHHRDRRNRRAPCPGRARHPDLQERRRPGEARQDRSPTRATWATRSPRSPRDQVQHAGQIVAIVVADTFEAAREARIGCTSTYAAETPSATFDSPGADRVDAVQPDKQEDTAPKVGDAAAALASAPVTVDAAYETPTQHHNPIELFTTAAAWDGDQLTIWEPSQNMYGFQFGIADQLGLDPAECPRDLALRRRRASARAAR